MATEELIWVMADNTAYKCQVWPQACPDCGRRCIVPLPKPMAEQQPDATTHVCHPSIGGCNQGFEVDRPFAEAIKEQPQ